MARELVQPAHDLGERPDAAVTGVEVGGPRAAFEQVRGRFLRAGAVGFVGELLGLLHGEAKDARGVAHRGAAAVGDRLADHRRVIPAVAAIDVLDDLLAVPVREVDVDVGRLAPFFGEEALEQQLHPDRVDGRDAEAVAHRGVRRGAAALRQHAEAARLADYVPHDEEIAGEAEPLDDVELVADLLLVALGEAVPVALARSRGHERGEVRVGGDAGRQRERRQHRGQLPHPERAPLGDLPRRGERLGVVTPAMRDPIGVLEVPLAVGAKQGAGQIERGLVAEAREHVVHQAPLRCRVVDVVGDHPRQVERAGEHDELRHDRALLGERVVPALDGDAASEHFGQPAEACVGGGLIVLRQQLRDFAVRAAGEAEQARRVTFDPIPGYGRGTPFSAARCGDELGEVPVSLLVHRQQRQM